MAIEQARSPIEIVATVYWMKDTEEYEARMNLFEAEVKPGKNSCIGEPGNIKAYQASDD